MGGKELNLLKQVRPREQHCTALCVIQVVKHIGALQRLPDLAEATLAPDSKESDFYAQMRKKEKSKGQVYQIVVLSHSLISRLLVGDQKPELLTLYQP